MINVESNDLDIQQNSPNSQCQISKTNPLGWQYWDPAWMYKVQACGLNDINAVMVMGVNIFAKCKNVANLIKSAESTSLYEQH